MRVPSVNATNAVICNMLASLSVEPVYRTGCSTSVSICSSSWRDADAPRSSSTWSSAVVGIVKSAPSFERRNRRTSASIASSSSIRSVTRCSMPRRQYREILGPELGLHPNPPTRTDIGGALNYCRLRSSAVFGYQESAVAIAYCERSFPPHVAAAAWRRHGNSCPPHPICPLHPQSSCNQFLLRGNFPPSRRI